MKGQWFIISAVVITSFLVMLSGIFRDYSAAGFPVPSHETFYFENVKGLLKKTVSGSPPDCASIEKNLTEAVYFTSSRMASLGFVQETSFVPVDCAQKRYSITLTIYSNKGRKTETFTT